MITGDHVLKYPVVETPLAAVEVTRMLQAWRGGDMSVMERLTPIVYAELHRIARRNLAAEREGHLLQPTALVNEAFCRLLGDAPVEWASRAHFFGFSARLMRQILIDFARAQDTGKRGHRSPHVALSVAGDVAASQTDPIELIDLDQALEDLAQLDARQAKLVELRYFGGLENAEIAAVLGISEPTVVRDWRVARAWLFDRLRSVKDGPRDAPPL
jgi:RNA polymerase sigma-70 factor, ECF subfamily